MPRVKLPKTKGPPAWSELPSGGRVSVLLGRREFLKAVGALAVALALPVTQARRTWAGLRGRFFTGHERATLAAYADRIIPRDTDPGAADLGVVHYVESLLTALDQRGGHIFAGGPFSNRNPYPDYAHGVPGHRRPHDDFRMFLPMTRLQRLVWRAELFGSATVPEIAALDGQNGGTALVGLRDIYRMGLAMIDQVARQQHGDVFVKLAAADQDDVFQKMEGYTPDPRRDTFNDIVIGHTLEGCFGAPEYGGNKRLGGWKMIGLEGDSQPLGYSIFDRTANVYRERADHPMTTINPDEIAGPLPLTADSVALQMTISALSNGLSGDGSR